MSWLRCIYNFMTNNVEIKDKVKKRKYVKRLKKCSKCGETKNRDLFPKTGRQCKACVCKYQMEWQKKKRILKIPAIDMLKADILEYLLTNKPTTASIIANNTTGISEDHNVNAMLCKLVVEGLVLKNNDGRYTINPRYKTIKEGASV